MIQAGILNVLVTATTGQANAALRKTQAQFRSTAATASSTSTATAAAWKKVGLGLVGIGAAAVKLTSDFNQSMTLIETQAGAPVGEIDRLRDSVLDLARSGRSEFGPQQLADALFRIESAGFRGAEAMDLLKKSSELAAVGQADLEATTYALTSAMNSQIKGAETADKTIGLLNAAVGQGNMRMEDLTSAMGTGFLSSAKAFGVTLRDATSALDLMTRSGTPAQAAATRLRMTFALMGAPKDTAVKAFKSIGLGATDLAETMRGPGGLVAAVELLQEHLQGMSKVKQAQILTQAFGGGRSSGAIIQMVNNITDLRDIYEQTGKQQGKFNEAAQKQAQQTEAQFQEAWASIQASLIDLGDTMAGPAGEALLVLAKGVAGVVSVFSEMPDAVKEALIALVVWKAAIGPLFSKMGQVGAMNMSSAFGKNLAIGFAAFSIIDIIEDSQHGSMRDVGFDMGGALAGGIIGGIAGGPWGAVLGASIGEQLGGAISGAFDDLEVDPKSVRDALKETDQAMRRSAKHWETSVDNLDASTKKLNRSRRRQKETAKEVKRLEEKLAEDRQKFGPNDDRTLQTERALVRARHRNIKAIHAEKAAEKEHGLAAKQTEIDLRHRLKLQYAQIQVLKNIEGRQKRHFKDLFKEEGQTQRTRKAGEEWATTQKQLRKVEGNRRTLLKEATDKLMPKQVKELRQSAKAQASVKVRTDRLTRAFYNTTEAGGKATQHVKELSKGLDRLDRHHLPFHTFEQAAHDLVIRGLDPLHTRTDQIAGKTRVFGDRMITAKGKVEKLTDVVKSEKDILKDLQTQSRHTGSGIRSDTQQSQRIGGDAMEALGDQLNHVLQQMGVKKRVHFGMQKKAEGGMVVPGHGVGDKVHFEAMLEPGEMPFILNRHATRELQALNKANSTYSRFSGTIPAAQDGGLLPHMARGGTVGSLGDVGGLKQGAYNLARTLVTRFGGSVSSGLRAGDSDSLHSTGQAFDWVGGDWAGAARYVNTLGQQLLEGIYNPGTHGGSAVSWDTGKRVPSSFWGGATWTQHLTHIHAAIADFRKRVVAQLKRITITGPAGDLKDMAQGAADMVWKEGNKFIERMQPQQGPEIGGGTFGGKGNFMSSAYGPPWGGIQGTGVTATGINLKDGHKEYIVAVDPSVIPLHSQLRIQPNPFGTKHTFAAEDTGGAILGNRIDFYDWLGRAHQNEWGMRRVQVTGAQRGMLLKALRRGGLMQAQRVRDHLGDVMKHVGKLDERIDIAQTKAGLESSPGGSELSLDEIQIQMRLQEKLLEDLKKARHIATRGARMAGKALDNLKGEDAKRIQDRINALNKLVDSGEDKIKAEEDKEHPNKHRLKNLRKKVNSQKSKVEDLQKELDKEKGKDKNYKDKLTNLRSTFRERITEMAGVTGSGGRIFDTKIAIQELKDTASAGAGGIGIEDLMQFAEAMRYGAFRSEMPALAGGTDFHRGGMALVGEEGPEIVEIPMGAKVHPTGTGPGGDINVEVNVADGMGWLKQFIDVQVTRKDRRDYNHYRAGVSRSR